MFNLLLCVIIGILVYLVPHSLSPQAWGLFSIFIATILGIILRPYPMGAVTLMGLCVAVLTGVFDLQTEALSGFSSPIPWLVVMVFFVSRGFIKTKLGLRIAYNFINLMGKRTLTLGYSVALSDLLIAPFVPSNTARAGGIMLPIVKSMCAALDSTPTANASLGRYLMQVMFQSNVITSALFLTSCAVNPLVQKFALDLGIQITWGNWFLGSIVPGLCALFVMPLLIMVLAKPEIKVLTGAKEYAQKELRDLGSMSTKEWLMSGIFGIMLTLWMFEGYFHVHTATVAFFGVALCLICDIITLEDMLAEKEAWHTLIWLSILITMSTYLQKFGFITWFVGSLAGLTQGMTGMQTLVILSLLYFYSHYFFAGNTAQVSAMYAAFVGVCIAAGAPPLLTVLVLGYCSTLFSSMTHYGTACAPMVFAQGYMSLKTWWRIGLVFSIFNLCIWGGIGSVWWKIVGIY